MQTTIVMPICTVDFAIAIEVGIFKPVIAFSPDSWDPGNFPGILCSSLVVKNRIKFW